MACSLEFYRQRIGIFNSHINRAVTHRKAKNNNPNSSRYLITVSILLTITSILMTGFMVQVAYIMPIRSCQAQTQLSSSCNGFNILENTNNRLNWESGTWYSVLCVKDENIGGRLLYLQYLHGNPKLV